MRIALVRKGDKYGAEYVEAMHHQISPAEHHIITLTDRKDTPGETYPLNYELEGWWSKIELFSPQYKLFRPFLFIDLDSFVLGDLNKYNMGNYFTMVEDYNGYCRANSSVMWIPDTLQVDYIWKMFWQRPKTIMRKFKNQGDQGYLGDYYEKLWKTPEDGIVSYKIHGKEGPKGDIMQFHGRPKPKDCNDWAYQQWQDIQEMVKANKTKSY